MGQGSWRKRVPLYRDEELLFQLTACICSLTSALEVILLQLPQQSFLYSEKTLKFSHVLFGRLHSSMSSCITDCTEVLLKV